MCARQGAHWSLDIFAFAPTVQNSIAQPNGLGIRRLNNSGLKGRDICLLSPRQCRPFRASFSIILKPRALPWAIVSRTFGAFSQMSKLQGEQDSRFIPVLRTFHLCANGQNSIAQFIGLALEGGYFAFSPTVQNSIAQPNGLGLKCEHFPFAPTVQNSIAQPNGLGIRRLNKSGLKGRDNSALSPRLCRSFRALFCIILKPRALPWDVISRTFGASRKYPNFSVRPAGRAHLAVQVRRTPDKGKFPRNHRPASPPPAKFSHHTSSEVILGELLVLRFDKSG